MTMTQSPQIVMLPTTAITVENELRDDSVSVEDLLPSMQELGIIEPLIVRKLPDGATALVAGGRRLRAAKLIGLDFVPVIYRDLSFIKAREVELIENLNRLDLSPIQEARGILSYLALKFADHPEFVEYNARKDNTPEGKMASLLYRFRKAAAGDKDKGITSEQAEAQMRGAYPLADGIIGTMEGFGKKWRYFAENYLSVLSYPPEVVEAVNDRTMGLKAAREVANVKDDGLRQEAIDLTKRLMTEGRMENHQAAKKAVSEVLTRAKAIKNVGQLGDQMAARPQSGKPGWQLPEQSALLVSDPRFEDLYEHFWRDVKPVFEGEVPVGVYQRLLVRHSKIGQKVLSLGSSSAPLLDIALDLGRPVMAIAAEAGRPSVSVEDLRDLKLQDDEADLAFLHLPAWGEVRLTDELGWGPEARRLDLSLIEGWEEFRDAISDAYSEAQRVASKIVVICREVEHYERTYPIPAIVQVALGANLISVHRFAGANGLTTAVVGRSPR